MARKRILLAGIDVSAKTLQVALLGKDGQTRDLTFENTDAGHTKLVHVLTAGRVSARTIVEATSTYSLDLCLALHRGGIEVMVVNPKAAKKFADAQLQRAKTDRVDARMLLEFLQRMEFVPWNPPSALRLALAMIVRRVAACVVQRTAELNRLAAMRATKTTPDLLIADAESAIADLERRIDALEEEALKLARGDDEIAKMLSTITTTRGIAERSGMRILGELLLLPQDMTVAQVTAHAGLDPRPRESGQRAPRRAISRIGNARLRHALFMPALTAIKWDPNVAAYYEGLIARGKPKMVAVVAVMRKLLGAIWTMMHTLEVWDSSRFSGQPVRTTAVA